MAVSRSSDAAQRRPPISLPPEAEEIRTEVRCFRATWEQLPEGDRHRALVGAGYLFPHWPAPWGRGAGPVEQLVIEDELPASAHGPELGPTAWTLPIVLPTIVKYGTQDQQDRWIRPAMEGNIRWCQLFSEPGAGSDLASLSTRAERVDGGWLVTGQKVWTSHAQFADCGFALVRTNPDASRHHGISCLVVDMRAPGVTIRPLRQITGSSEFNEVFLDEVFVPDCNVIGQVDHGWQVARTTLGNERVSLGEGGNIGRHWALVGDLAKNAPPESGAVREYGALLARAEALRAMNLRSALRAVAGTEQGAEGSLTKLIGAELGQGLADLGVQLLGVEAGVLDGNARPLVELFLGCRMATIAGGTSQVLRNVIAERLLGLPRDP